MKTLARALGLILLILGALTVNPVVIAVGVLAWLVASIIGKLEDAEFRASVMSTDMEALEQKLDENTRLLRDIRNTIDTPRSVPSHPMQADSNSAREEYLRDFHQK